jgi:hypothetical protein
MRPALLRVTGRIFLKLRITRRAQRRTVRPRSVEFPCDGFGACDNLSRTACRISRSTCDILMTDLSHLTHRDPIAARKQPDRNLLPWAYPAASVLKHVA